MRASTTAILLAAGLSLGAQVSAEPVNAEIGDTSWYSVGATEPDAAGEVERIRTHLLFVADALDSEKVSHLDLTVRSRRAGLLAHLRDYARAGIFPIRGADPFDGRRPQFIDHRGVHCAVGELMRASGHEDLAHRVDADFEYSYVPEIETVGVAEWAEVHGFSLQELAEIQPAYSAPPSKETVRAYVMDAVRSLTVTCGREHGVPEQVKIHLHGDNGGRVGVELNEKVSPFGVCFVNAIQKLRLGGGAWAQSPKAFSFRETIALPRPQEMAAAWMEIHALARSTCSVRPGELAESAHVQFEANADVMALSVTTEPRNAETELCLVNELQPRALQLGRGNWNINLDTTVRFKRHVASDVIQNMTTQYLPRAATECYAEGAPPRVVVEVSAVPDADSFAIAVTGGTEKYQACVADHLQGQLVSAFSVGRRIYDNSTEPKYERYFRIDGSAKTRVEQGVETPEAREARLLEIEQRVDRDRGW